MMDSQGYFNKVNQQQQTDNESMMKIKTYVEKYSWMFTGLLIYETESKPFIQFLTDNVICDDTLYNYLCRYEMIYNEIPESFRVEQIYDTEARKYYYAFMWSDLT